MKLSKFFFLYTLCFAIYFSAHSQHTDSLRMQSNFFGNKFFKGDTIISVNQVLEEMASNESIYNLMKDAKTDFVFSQILGATGGFLVGWQLAAAVGSGEPNWALAGVGIGIIVISIPISINFKKKANEAINRYNRTITSSNSRNHKPMYNLGFGGNGLKFQVRF